MFDKTLSVRKSNVGLSSAHAERHETLCPFAHCHASSVHRFQCKHSAEKLQRKTRSPAVRFLSIVYGSEADGALGFLQKISKTYRYLTVIKALPLQRQEQRHFSSRARKT